jgi:hypothetical protein
MACVSLLFFLVVFVSSLLKRKFHVQLWINFYCRKHHCLYCLSICFIWIKLYSKFLFFLSIFFSIPLLPTVQLEFHFQPNLMGFREKLRCVLTVACSSAITTLTLDHNFLEGYEDHVVLFIVSLAAGNWWMNKYSLFFLHYLI